MGKLNPRLSIDSPEVPFRSRRDKIRTHSSRLETSASKITLFFSGLGENCAEIFRVSNRWEHFYCTWILSWRFFLKYLFWIRAVGTLTVWVGRDLTKCIIATICLKFGVHGFRVKTDVKLPQVSLLQLIVYVSYKFYRIQKNLHWARLSLLTKQQKACWEECDFDSCTCNFLPMHMCI